MLAVLAEKSLRGDTCKAFEVSGEVALIKKTNFARDLSNCQFVLEQEGFGAFHACIENVLMWGYSRNLFEGAYKVRGTHTSQVGQLSQRELLVKMLVDVLEDGS